MSGCRDRGVGCYVQPDTPTPHRARRHVEARGCEGLRSQRRSVQVEIERIMSSIESAHSVQIVGPSDEAMAGGVGGDGRKEGASGAWRAGACSVKAGADHGKREGGRHRRCVVAGDGGRGRCN